MFCYPSSMLYCQVFFSHSVRILVNEYFFSCILHTLFIDVWLTFFFLLVWTNILVGVFRYLNFVLILFFFIVWIIMLNILVVEFVIFILNPRIVVVKKNKRKKKKMFWCSYIGFFFVCKKFNKINWFWHLTFLQRFK